jgi:hypothetical protein
MNSPTHQTEAKHTPGPWHVNTQPTYEGGHTIASASGLVVVNSVKGYGRTDDQNEANARLIAAAPELLTALQSLTLETSHHLQSNDRAQFVENALRNAMQALAKALNA